MPSPESSDYLENDHEIVYWVSLGVFAIAALAALLLWIKIYLCSKVQHLSPKLKIQTCDRCLPSNNIKTMEGHHKHQQKIYLDDKSSCFSFRSLSIAFVIFALNTLLYGILLMGQGTVYNADVDVYVPWVRWVIYALSCTLLAYEIATFQKMEQFVKYIFTFLITFTLLTGVFSTLSVESYTNRWIWYGIGFAPYLIALVILFFFSDPCNKLKCIPKWVIPVFVLIFWSIYPIAFILGPNIFDVISLTIESSIYLAADLITKIFFAFWIARISE